MRQGQNATHFSMVNKVTVTSSKQGLESPGGATVEAMNFLGFQTPNPREEIFGPPKITLPKRSFTSAGMTGRLLGCPAGT